MEWEAGLFLTQPQAKWLPSLFSSLLKLVAPQSPSYRNASLFLSTFSLLIVCVSLIYYKRFQFSATGKVSVSSGAAQ